MSMKQQQGKNFRWITEEERIKLIAQSSKQISRGIFFATVIIITSFLPVFMLTGQEGKLFHPLAWTKTFILVIDAILVITLGPVLLSFFMRGQFREDRSNLVNKLLERFYQPLLMGVLKWRKVALTVNIIALIVAIPMLKSLGTEFMPPLDEGSILFMPVTLPDVSNEEIKRILLVQDKIIQTLPEVDKVLGKAGRAATATDNAPLSMIETIIMLKPKAQWRAGKSKQDIINELDARLQIPGVVNGWTQPIINRINMQSTDIRTDVGIKIYGPEISTIGHLSAKIKQVLDSIPGIHDIYVEPLTGGQYLSVNIRREELARYGLQIDDISQSIAIYMGGVEVGNTSEGRQRFPITIKVAQDYRNSVAQLMQLPVMSLSFGEVPLSAVADIKFVTGPSMITSDNAMMRGAVLFNVRGRDLGNTIKDAVNVMNKTMSVLPNGYFMEWSGQYEHLIHARRTLLWILPVVVLIIFLSLYGAFHSIKEALLSLITVPFALIGGAYLLYFQGVNLSVAVAVGFIALFGIAVETGIVMVIYLNDAMRQLVRNKMEANAPVTREDLYEYVIYGAARRLRPKIMTVCVSLFGLIPVLWSESTGADVMKPIVLPIIGGVFTSSIHILLTTPLIFLMSKEYELRKYGKLLINERYH